MKISEVSEKYNIPVDTKKHLALIGKGVIEGQKVVLVKPQTYMNLSGESIRASTLNERKQILIDERKKLIEKRDAIQSTIERLDYKINSYEHTIAICEKELLKRK